jgi:hypothetical protein
MDPPESVRIIESCLRSAMYISKEGNMYRYYFDTKTWKNVQPRCDDNGRTCGYKNKSIPRLIAEAWLDKPGIVTSQNRLPNVRIIDKTKNPYNVDNLEWCHSRRCTQGDYNNTLPPKLEYLKEILEEYDIESIEDIANLLEVTESTTWNYLCKLISIQSELHLAQKAVEFIHQDCLKLCLETELNGPLSNAMEYIQELLKNDTEWSKEEYKYSHLRLARMYCDLLK